MPQRIASLATIPVLFRLQPAQVDFDCNVQQKRLRHRRYRHVWFSDFVVVCRRQRSTYQRAMSMGRALRPFLL